MIPDEVDTDTYRGKTIRRHREKTATYKLGTESSCTALRRDQVYPNTDLRLPAAMTMRKHISDIEATQFVALCYSKLM